MAELDPSIIFQAGNFPKLNVGAVLEQRRQMRLSDLAIAKSQRDDAAAQSQTQRLSQIGQQYASGDTTGARASAGAAGDFELIKTLDSLDDAGRKRVADIAEATAPLVYSLKNVPPERRADALGQIAPELLARGYKPEQIQKLANNGLGDQQLDRIAQSALTIKDYYERQDKALDRGVRQDEAQATREFARGNAYISAGIIPPGEGAATGGATGGAVGGRTQFGYTPRARNGGDNSDAAVDGKIVGMSKYLGIDPTAPFPPGTSDLQIAKALTLSEGGSGSLADRNNNPGNLKDPKTGAFRRYPTKEAGLAAVAAQVARNRARGQNSIVSMVEGVPVGGQAGGLRPIPGGKLDKPRAQRMTPQEVQAEGLDPNLTYYRGTDGVPQAVSGQNNKTGLKPPPVRVMEGYVGNRTSLSKIDQALAAVKAYPDAVGFLNGLTPNAILSRTDPKGVTARALIADIGSLKIHDRSGAAVTASETPRLLPFIPQVGDTAETVEKKLANFKTELAAMQADIEDVYSEDQGFKFPKFRGGSSRPTLTPNANAVPVMTPEQARNAPPGTRFKTTDGRVMVKR